jgi:arginyl-tRNA synthetase
MLMKTEKSSVELRNKSLFFNVLTRSAKLEDKAEAVARAIAAFHTPGAAALDAAQMAEQSYGNPLFNVQYGHARAHAVYRRARESFPDLPMAPEPRLALWRAAALDRLNHETESALLRLIGLFPQVLETAAAQLQPHRLGSYLNTLAGAFHTQLRHGMTTPHLRFISQDDRELTVARLALVEAVVIILGAGLSQLGFEAPNEIT